MKISREARQQARRLFRSCTTEGQLDPVRICTVVTELLQRRPRGYLAIADRIRALVALEVSRRTHVVRSAVPLADQGQSIFQKLEATFGVPLARQYLVTPDLIGGLSIQVGSDIWDGSIKHKLQFFNSTVN